MRSMTRNDKIFQKSLQEPLDAHSVPTVLLSMGSMNAMKFLRTIIAAKPHMTAPHATVPNALLVPKKLISLFNLITTSAMLNHKTHNRADQQNEKEFILKHDIERS